MKVNELIGILEKMPPDVIVLVNGYEGGYTDPETVELHGVYVDSDNSVSDYFGNYEIDDEKSLKAVVFERGQ